MDPKEVYKTWQHCIPEVGPFRASVKVWKGTKGRLGYTYVTFTKPEQFKTWLKLNQSKIYDVTNVGV